LLLESGTGNRGARTKPGASRSLQLDDDSQLAY
jgi:hypothetical protein